jgi:hypothetical protein
MTKIINFTILLHLIFFNISAKSFENNKQEIGVYFSTKIYEERHPVDNSFFMSQDGYMLGAVFSADNFSDETYFGYKMRLGLGEVSYTSAGTGTMENIPDYQLEGTIDQEEGSGIKLSAKYYLDSTFAIEGYMDYWDIADSKVDISGSFMEPRNTTSETGIRLVWKY